MLLNQPKTQFKTFLLLSSCSLEITFKKLSFLLLTSVKLYRQLLIHTVKVNLLQCNEWYLTLGTTKLTSKLPSILSLTARVAISSLTVYLIVMMMSMLSVSTASTNSSPCGTVKSHKAFRT